MSHLVSGTVLDSACGTTASCLGEACSLFGTLPVLLGCELAWFDSTTWALWGNCTPAFCKRYQIKGRKYWHSNAYNDFCLCSLEQLLFLLFLVTNMLVANCEPGGYGYHVYPSQVWTLKHSSYQYAIQEFVSHSCTYHQIIICMIILRKFSRSTTKGWLRGI